MKLGVSGIVVNERGELLVVKRSDTRTWAVPGGAIEAGESPMQAVVREMFEETGLKLLPVRLVGLHVVSLLGQEVLQFVFRCLIRGGELQKSAESLEIGYTPTKPLGVEMLDYHRQQLDFALQHHGGVPRWEKIDLSLRDQLTMRALQHVIYPYKNWRQLDQEQPYQAPLEWRVEVAVVVHYKRSKEALWLCRRDNGLWTIPMGAVQLGETPWQSAVRHVWEQAGLRAMLTDLKGVYTFGDQRVVLLFSAEAPPQSPTHSQQFLESAYLAEGMERNPYPDTLLWVRDSAQEESGTQFRMMGT